jgi:sugar-specific transcriptional regulator TrmB
MNHEHKAKLEQLGLSPAEAQVYLATLQDGPLAAAAIANQTGMPRTSVYPTLCSLADKGLVEGGAGYGSKFAAVSPAQALPALVVREKQMLSDRERIASELAGMLEPLAANAEFALDDAVQVIRSRQVIAERFDRLQLEAERTVDVIIKAPILNPRKDNPAQQKAQRRGVHFRGLYERAAIEDPVIKPYIQGWIASGEEARVYDGELPYKLLIFDEEIVLMILTRRGGQSSALFVRHEPLAKSLTQWFNFLWEEAKPLTARTLMGVRSSKRVPANREQGARKAARAKTPILTNRLCIKTSRDGAQLKNLSSEHT